MDDICHLSASQPWVRYSALIITLMETVLWRLVVIIIIININNVYKPGVRAPGHSTFYSFYYVHLSISVHSAPACVLSGSKLGHSLIRSVLYSPTVVLSASSIIQCNNTKHDHSVSGPIACPQFQDCAQYRNLDLDSGLTSRPQNGTGNVAHDKCE